MDIDVSQLSTAPKTNTNKFFVTVYFTNSPEKPIFKGFVKSISSTDFKGAFDILPMHENFVANINQGIEFITESGQRVGYQIKKGVLEVANNIARVFITI